MLAATSFLLADPAARRATPSFHGQCQPRVHLHTASALGQKAFDLLGVNPVSQTQQAAALAVP
jgi:hypothetical protein